MSTFKKGTVAFSLLLVLWVSFQAVACLYSSVLLQAFASKHRTEGPPSPIYPIWNLQKLFTLWLGHVFHQLLDILSHYLPTEFSLSHVSLSFWELQFHACWVFASSPSGLSCSCLIPPLFSVLWFRYLLLTWLLVPESFLVWRITSC